MFYRTEQEAVHERIIDEEQAAIPGPSALVRLLQMVGVVWG